jgi:hypothetical protein
VIDKSAGEKCAFNESPLSWNAAGVTGAAGASGATGPTGPTGPGATTFVTTLPHDNNFHTLATLDNGVVVQGQCTSAGGVGLNILPATVGAHLQMSGTKNGDLAVSAADGDGIPSSSILFSSTVDYDVLVRDETVGPFERLDVHGSFKTPADCNFWGMIIPSS